MTKQQLIDKGVKYLGVKIPCSDFELSELPQSLEDSIHRTDDAFVITIDIAEHRALNWCDGPVHIFLKLVDTGAYYLLDERANRIAHIDGGYVPSILDFNGKSYGDYLTLDIDENGNITNWRDREFDIDGWIVSSGENRGCKLEDTI